MEKKKDKCSIRPWDYAHNEGSGMYFPWQTAEKSLRSLSASESLRMFHVVFIMDSVFVQFSDCPQIFIWRNGSHYAIP